MIDLYSYIEDPGLVEFLQLRRLLDRAAKEDIEHPEIASKRDSMFYAAIVLWQDQPVFAMLGVVAIGAMLLKFIWIFMMLLIGLI